MNEFLFGNLEENCQEIGLLKENSMKFEFLSLE